VGWGGVGWGGVGWGGVGWGGVVHVETFVHNKNSTAYQETGGHVISTCR
jgi:hypothetical protein